MKPSEALDLHRDAARAIFDKYPVTNPRIFGSVARGEDTEESDLDVLVERAGRLTYFDLAELEQELRDLMGIRIDVRTSGEFSTCGLSRISGDFRQL